MSMFNEWSHRWFGFWRDTLPYKEQGPSILDFIDENWCYADIDKVTTYLMTAPTLIHLMSWDCPLCGSTTGGSIRTDGYLLWREDIASHMLAHGVRIPDIFLKHIEAKNFIPPKVVEIERDQLATSLEWPEKMKNLLTVWQQRPSGKLVFEPRLTEASKRWLIRLQNSDSIRKIKTENCSTGQNEVRYKRL